VPDVYFEGDCGLMSMCLHPDFVEHPFVYLYYGDQVQKDCRIVRLRLDTGDGKVDSPAALVEPTTIFKGIPLYHYHAAGTIRFGPDGKLYATTGDCWQMDTAQDPLHLGGKFLRLEEDGSIPKDNPHVHDSAFHPAIFAIGSRNSQGIDWQPGSGLLFSTEHGPSGEKIRQPTGGADEFNIVRPGSNLGWPKAHADNNEPGMQAPLIWFKHTIAPGSGMFYTGSATPALTNNYFVGCMRAHALMRIELDGERVVDWMTVLDDLGRIRALAQGPLDASKPFGDEHPANTVLYFASSNRDRYASKETASQLEDRIYRIVP
jgi:aldose sugar dehydrogenase